MSIQNLHTRDPFAEAEAAAAIQARPVHIRLQQRNGGRTITTVQGLSSGYDLKKVVRCCKKDFACNGTLLESPEYGQVIQLQGDQRLKIHQWLTKMQLASSDQLKVCGL